MEKYIDNIIITEDHINKIYNQSEVKTFRSFDNVIIVSCKLPNGFMIIETETRINSNEYNEKICIEMCEKRIKEVIFNLDDYILSGLLRRLKI